MKPGPVRTRRIVSLLVALVAGIVWVLGTLANPANAWDPLNFLLRVVAGVVTVAAVAEWVVLVLRAVRRGPADDDPSGGAAGDDGGPRAEVVALGTVPVVPPEPAAPPEPAPPPDPAPPRDGAAVHDGARVPDGAGPRATAGPRDVVEAGAGAVARETGEPTGADQGSAAPEPWPTRAARRAQRARRDPRRRAARPRESRRTGRAVPGLAGRGRRRSSEEALAAVVAGGSVRVVAYLMERKIRRVTLRVGLDPASLDGLAEVLGAAPHRVFSTHAPTRGRFRRSAHTQVEGASGSGAWSIAVPTEHVQLLRYVLARATGLPRASDTDLDVR